MHWQRLWHRDSGWSELHPLQASLHSFEPTSCIHLSLCLVKKIGCPPDVPVMKRPQLSHSGWTRRFPVPCSKKISKREVTRRPESSKTSIYSGNSRGSTSTRAGCLEMDLQSASSIISKLVIMIDQTIVALDIISNLMSSRLTELGCTCLIYPEPLIKKTVQEGGESRSRISPVGAPWTALAIII
jgi:hypothetical protein